MGRQQIPQPMSDSGSTSASLDAALEKLQEPIYRYVVGLVGRGDAEDVTQDIFVKVLDGIHTFRGQSSLKTWVYRIALNTCRDHLRRQRWRNLWVWTTDSEPKCVSGNDDAFDQLDTKELITRCLRSLPLKHQEVLILRDIQGFRYDEMAQILRCSIGTIKSRLHWGRRQLAKALQEEGLNL